MGKGVAVTGMGVISAIGNNVEENLRSLLHTQHGIFPAQFLETRHLDLPVGEVKLSNEILQNYLQLQPGHAYTRAALLGAIAIREALLQARLSKAEIKTMGFISASSVGGMDMTEKYYSQFNINPEHSRFIQAQHPGFTTTKIQEYFGINGFVTTISTACSSSANAIMLGARLIKAGKLKRVIVGGTDCLTKFTLNGFNSLKILSAEACRPFDEDRSGLNLGEGAAYLILEAEDLVGNREILGRVKGYGNSNDAFHQTASSESGEGAFLAMQKALKTASLSFHDIDHINAHGTATKNNDLSESVAIKRIFSQKVPDLTSTKSYTGHTLAAAGSLEAVYSLLSLKREIIFPCLNFREPMKETGLIPVTRVKNKMMKHVLSNSFGFGGNCTSLIFTRDEK